MYSTRNCTTSAPKSTSSKAVSMHYPSHVPPQPSRHGVQHGCNPLELSRLTTAERRREHGTGPMENGGLKVEAIGEGTGEMSVSGLESGRF